MAYTVPHLDGSYKSKYYYNNLSNPMLMRIYEEGETIPTPKGSPEYHVLSVYMTQADYEESRGPYIISPPFWEFSDEGNDNFYTVRSAGRRDEINPDFEIPNTLFGKQVREISELFWYDELFAQSSCELITSYNRRIPSNIKYMNDLFLDQYELEGIITIDANPSAYADWLNGTVKPIKLTGNSSMLTELADGYNNVSVYVPPKASVLVQRVDENTHELADEGTTAKVTLTLQGDSVDTEYEVVINDGSTQHTESNITLQSSAEETFVFYYDGYSTENSFQFTASVTDNWGTTVTATDTLSTAFYTIHVAAGGKEIAFGCPANDQNVPNNGLAKFGMDTQFEGQVSGQGLLDYIYPIGSIYISTNTANPSTYLGGTWEPFGEGRCLLGAGTYNDGTDERTFSTGNSGGKYNHTLTAAQIPSKPHNHPITVTNGTNVVRTGNGNIGSQRGTINNSTTATYNYVRTEHDGVDMKANTITASSSNNSSAAASAHNNMQPYIVVCMWIRVTPTI